MNHQSINETINQLRFKQRNLANAIQATANKQSMLELINEMLQATRQISMLTLARDCAEAAQCVIDVRIP